MSDDPTNRGEPDRSRINPAQDDERRYWTKRRCVWEDEVRAAVRAVGDSVHEVQDDRQWQKRPSRSRAAFVSASLSGRRALAAMVVASAVLAAPELLAREWHFDVTADGIPVGAFDVTVQESGGTGVAMSDMTVGVFGIGSYRQHEEETWKGGCLAHIASRTEEHGHVTAITGWQEGNAFHIAGVTRIELKGCIMSFAYWNPNILKQSHLVNVQTGAWTQVSMRDLGQQTIEVGGRPVRAAHHAIETERNTIEVWYSLEGDWLGLKTTTRSGGHVLAYRLRSSAG